MFVVGCGGPPFEKADIVVKGMDEAEAVILVCERRQFILRERVEESFRVCAIAVPEPASSLCPEVGASLIQSIGLQHFLEHEGPGVVEKESLDFREQVEFIQVLGVDRLAVVHKYWFAIIERTLV